MSQIKPFQLSVNMLNVIMLSVDMQNVVAPCNYDDYFSVTNKCFMADFHENETKERKK